jgi:hypothetical protein
VAAVVFLLPLKRLADIHGRKRVFSAGLACFLAGSVGALGWRGIFWMNAALCAAALWLAFRYIRHEWREAAGERFDLAGAALYAAVMIALTHGLSALPGARGYVSLAAAAAGLAFFGRWELSAPAPLIDLSVLRDNRVFALSNLAALINYAATFAVGFLVSLYLQCVRGLPPQHAGLMMMSQPVMQAVFSPLAGRLSDRVEPRLIASAMVGTMRMLGQMFSMGAATLVIAVVIGRNEIGPGIRAAFLAGAQGLLGGFAALSALGIFASLARGRVHGR